MKITVDKRTELMNIMLFQSDYGIKHPDLVTYGKNTEEYHRKIDDHFSKFKDSKAIKLLNQVIQTTSFSYDAPIELILQLEEDYSIKKLNSYPFYTRLKSSPLVLEFLNEIPNFVKESNFEKFYDENKDFYQKVIDETRGKCEKWDYKKLLEDYYGVEIKKQLVINAMPSFSFGNFGVDAESDSLRINLCVNKNSVSNFYGNTENFDLCIHEFSHGFINPLVHSHFENNLISIKENWDKNIMPSCYNSSTSTIIIETFVRAITGRIIQPYISQDYYDKYTLGMYKQGFTKCYDDAIKSLEYYENHRDEYPTFESFYPKLFDDVFTKRESIKE